MLEGINIEERHEFISKTDKGDPKTVFVLKPLSGADMLATSQKDNNAEQLTAMLKSSIVEIKNFATDDVDKAIEMLPMGVLSELLTFVNKLNHIGENDEKNS